VEAPLPADTEFPPFQDFDVVHNYLQSKSPKMQARLRKRGQKGEATDEKLLFLFYKCLIILNFNYWILFIPIT